MISSTKINMYLRCPRQYWFRYVQDMRVPPAGGLILGRSFHETLKKNFIQKLKTEKDLSHQDLDDIYVDALNKEITENSEIYDDFQLDEAPEVLREDGRKLVKLARVEYTPKIYPKLVEEKIEIKILQYDIQGFLDLVTKENIIHDYKTGKSSMTANIPIFDLQLSLYSFLFKSIYKQQELQQVEAHKVGFIRSKQPKIVHNTTTITQFHFNRLLKLLDYVNQAIAQGFFPPTPSADWMCNPQYCGYCELCKEEDL